MKLKQERSKEELAMKLQQSEREIAAIRVKARILN
jgi:hypothetical protein